MAIVAFSTLTPDVAVHVQGCPPPVIENALRSAAIDFCSRTGIWRKNLDAQNITGGVYDYTLNPPSGALVHKVLQVKCDNIPLTPLTAELLMAKFPTQPDTNVERRSTPTCYSMIDQRSIQLVPVPLDSIINGLKVMVSLRPTLDAAGVDSIAVDAYAEVLVHGALQRLVAIPEKPWSNPKSVEYHGHEFSVGISRARADAERGNTVANLRVAMRPFI